MRILLCAIASFLTCALYADTLIFDASTTANVTYIMRWGPNASGTIGLQNLGTNLFMSLTNGPWGTNYFQVNAVSTNGVESLGSNVVLATNRPAAPLQLRIIPATNVVYLERSLDGGFTWVRFDPIAARGAGALFRGLQPPFPTQ